MDSLLFSAVRRPTTAPARASNYRRALAVGSQPASGVRMCSQPDPDWLLERDFVITANAPPDPFEVRAFLPLRHRRIRNRMYAPPSPARAAP